MSNPVIKRGTILSWPSWKEGGLIKTPAATYIGIAPLTNKKTTGPLKAGTAVAYRDKQGVALPSSVEPWAKHWQRVTLQQKKEAAEKALAAAKLASEAKRRAAKIVADRIAAEKAARAKVEATRNAALAKVRAEREAKLRVAKALAAKKAAQEKAAAKRQGALKKKRQVRLLRLARRARARAARALAKHRKLVKEYGVVSGRLQSVDSVNKVAVVQVGRDRQRRVKFIHFCDRPKDWNAAIGTTLKFYNRSRHNFVKRAKVSVRLAVVTQVPNQRLGSFVVTDWNNPQQIYEVPTVGTTGVPPTAGSFVEVEIRQESGNSITIQRAHVRPHDVLSHNVEGVLLWFDGKTGIAQFKDIGDARVSLHSFVSASAATSVTDAPGVLSLIKATVIRVPDMFNEDARTRFVAADVTVVSKSAPGDLVKSGVTVTVSSVAPGELYVELEDGTAKDVLLPVCLLPKEQRNLVTVGSRLVMDLNLVSRQVLRCSNVSLQFPSADQLRHGTHHPHARVIEISDGTSHIKVVTEKGHVFSVPKPSIALTNPHGLAVGDPVDCYVQRDRNGNDVVTGAIPLKRLSAATTGTVLGVNRSRATVAITFHDGTANQTLEMPVTKLSSTLERRLLRRWAKVTFDLFENSIAVPPVPFHARLSALARVPITGSRLVGTFEAIPGKSRLGHLVAGDQRVLVRLSHLRPSVRWWLQQGHSVAFSVARSPDGASREAVRVRRLLDVVPVPVPSTDATPPPQARRRPTAKRH